MIGAQAERSFDLKVGLTIGTGLNAPATEHSLRSHVNPLAIDVGEQGNQERATHGGAVDS